jgi:hypothetical protein
MISKKKIAAGLITIPLAFNLHAASANPMFDLGVQIGSSLGSVISSGASALFASSSETKPEPTKTEEKKSDSSGGIGGFFGSLFKEATPEETIAKAEDKEMTKSFLDTKKANEKLALTFSNKAIDSDRVIVPFSNAKTFGQARSLCANIDSSNDEIATTYKKAVEDRGNYYTIYNGTVNMAILTAINGKLSTVNEYRDTFYNYDFENAIIEYAPNGTMVSALARVDKVNLNTMFKVSDINIANIEIRQASRVFFASSLGIVSRTVSKRLLDDNMVSTSKKEIQAVVVAPAVVAPVVDKSNTNQLKELFELYKAGALTKEEFDKEKQKLLAK